MDNGDYQTWHEATCQYPGSRMLFRGPPVSLDGGYVLCLGGSETYGKFVEDPFPVLMERRLSIPTVNMGAMNAGLDFLINDGAVAQAIKGAEAVILQVPGAANLTNCFYSVHPYRNDRFLRATGKLGRLLPQMETTDIHFTRHLLHRIGELSQRDYRTVIQALQSRWEDRMMLLLSQIAAPVHLLWASSRGRGAQADLSDLGADPLFVTPEMLERIVERVQSVTEVVTPPNHMRTTIRGMHCAPEQEAIARALPGPGFHFRTAAALMPCLATG